MICPRGRKGLGRQRVGPAVSLSAARFGVIMTLEFDDVCRLRGAARFLLALATKIACDENQRRRNMSISRLLLAFATASTVVSLAVAQTPPSRWGAGDELGMANTLGPATWQRCAQALANPKAKSYEVSYLRSNTMPQSTFGGPLRDKYRPPPTLPGTVHPYTAQPTHE